MSEIDVGKGPGKMADFDFRKIEREAEEEAAKTKEKELKHIEEISRGHDKVTPSDFSNPTKEQTENIRRETAKFGIVVNKEKKKEKRQFPAYKYSNRLRGDLHESIILSGRPFFVKYVNDKIDIANIIDEDNRILRPLDEEEYPYEPYRFEDKKEIEDFVKRAINEDHDSLFTKIGSIVASYNDQQYYKLNIISADIFASYFQDRFSTTHYDCITGGNGSGKSSLGDTYGALAYRPVNMTDPTAANLYRLLGPIEPGQCTMILEESEKIDQSQDLMSTLKTGYNLNGRVPRINMNTGNQEFFFSYCLKIIITERSPNQNVAKGVLDRVFSFTCYKGNPRRDIKEVLNPTNTGGPEHQQWLKELNDLRKLLFVYRLIHFKDPIPDIDIGIIGRDKELSKPLIQLFNGTKAQDGIVVTLQKLLDAKNKRKEARLESVLASLVIELISKLGLKFYHSVFWNYFRESVQGLQDEKKPNEYHTADFGTVYRNSITNILRDSFGVETKHEKGGNVLIFDENIIPVLQKQFTIKITIKKGEGYEGSEGSRKKASGNDTPRTTNIQHVENKLSDFYIENPNNIVKNTTEIISKASPYPQEPSQYSQPSPLDDNVIYRKYTGSDIWACRNCKLTGDKWFMQKHPCKGKRAAK